MIIISMIENIFIWFNIQYLKYDIFLYKKIIDFEEFIFINIFQIIQKDVYKNRKLIFENEIKKNIINIEILLIIIKINSSKIHNLNINS